jgi:hypothetical protein
MWRACASRGWCRSLFLAGMVPKQVRTDWAGRGLAGLVSVDWGDGPDRDKAEQVLVAILGATTEGCEGWQEWPIDPDGLPEGARRDAEQARQLAEYIGIADRAMWLFYIWKANQLARRSEFRRLAVAISEELERVEVLRAEDLEALIVTSRLSSRCRGPRATRVPSGSACRRGRTGCCRGAGCRAWRESPRPAA